jgi:hypothetical protein
MKTKGQIFSIDFILAAVLLVLFLGIMLNASGFKQYGEKERVIQDKFDSSVETAATTLLNGKYSCAFNGTNLSSSTDLTKISAATPDEIKQHLGLNNKNVFLLVGATEIINDPIDSKNVIALSFETLTCSNEISLQEIINCVGPCPAKETIVLKVGN